MARGKNTLVQRIALDGGDDLRKELEALGKDGARAFQQLQKAAHDAGDSMGARISRGIANARKELAPLGAAFANLGRSVVTFGRNLALIGGAIAGATAGLVAFTRSATQAANEVGKAAQGVGLAADEYQRLQFAAEQSNIAQGDFVTGLTRLNQEIGRAAAGNKASVDRFKQLGVAIHDANGQLRPTEAILRDLATAFQGLPNDARAAAIGSDFFGRSIATWLPLLREGGEAIGQLGDQFDATIGGFTDAQIALATEVEDAWNGMARSARALRQQIGLTFAGTVLRGIRAFQSVIIRNRDAMIAFAESVSARVAPIVADLFNTFTGNDAQVIDRRFIEWREAMTGFGQDVANVVTGFVVPAFRGIVSAADGVADAIRSVSLGFVDFTGRQLLIGAALLQLTGGFRVLRDMIRLAVAALTLLARHPVVATLVAVYTALAIVSNLASEAATATDRHRSALDRLSDAMGRARAGVAGAAEEYRALAAAQLASAGAAVIAAEAEVQAAIQRERAAQAQSLGRAGTGGVSDAMAQLETARTELAALREVIAGNEADLAQLGKAGGEAGAEMARGAREAADALDDAGEKAKRAFPGPAANIRSIHDNPFAPVEQGARDAGDEAEASGAKVETSANRMAQHIRTVPEEWRNASRAATDAGRETETATDAAADSAARLVDETEKLPAALADVGTGAQAALEPVNTAFAEAAASAAQVGEATGETMRAVEAKSLEVSLSLPDLFRRATEAISEAFRSAFDRVRGELNGLVASVNTAINTMTAALARLRAEIAAVRAAAAAAGASGGGGGGGSGFAGGGYVRGPGGPRGDKIPAQLSDTEFVQQAAAVEHYGVPFMSMLNAMRIPKDLIEALMRGRAGLERLLAAPRGYRDGGLVGHALNPSGFMDKVQRSITAAVPVQRFAGGGLAMAAPSGGGGAVNPFAGMARVDRLVIPGIGETPAILPVDVVRTIKRHDQRKAFASAGRRQEFAR